MSESLFESGDGRKAARMGRPVDGCSCDVHDVSWSRCEAAIGWEACLRAVTQRPYPLGRDQGYRRAGSLRLSPGPQYWRRIHGCRRGRLMSIDESRCAGAMAVRVADEGRVC